MRLKAIAPILLALALPLSGCTGQPAMKKFHVDLAGAHEVPPKESSGSGSADLTFVPASRQLSWKVSYNGLTSDATAAHIHGPAKPGGNAGVLIDLAPDGMKNPLEGSAILTDEQVDDLRLGRTYINIHTTQNKGGEIRGQIIP